MIPLIWGGGKPLRIGAVRRADARARVNARGTGKSALFKRGRSPGRMAGQMSANVSVEHLISISAKRSDYEEGCPKEVKYGCRLKQIKDKHRCNSRHGTRLAVLVLAEDTYADACE